MSHCMSASGCNSVPPTKLVRLGYDYWNWEDYALAKRCAQSQHSPLCESNPPADDSRALVEDSIVMGYFGWLRWFASIPATPTLQ